MAGIYTIPIRSRAFEYGASVVACGANLLDEDATVVGRILRCAGETIPITARLPR